MKSKFYLTS